MIIDGRLKDGLPETGYDLIIIGAGPAGLTLAQELGDTGLRIALLESGGEVYDDGAQSLNQGRIEGHDSYDLDTSRLRFLGGTSNHWGGQCTPFDRIDFERAPPGFSGWPMTYDEMVPFWQRAHRYCDLGAYQYDARALGPDDPQFWQLTDDRTIEPVVLRQSPPTRFGEKYSASLADSRTIHAWLWTNAVTVSTMPGAERETVETRTLDGTERRFQARAVVMAAGAIESTRLVLWSNAKNATQAGSAGTLLGRCYMDHLAGGIGTLHFDRHMPEQVQWTPIDTFADEGVPLHFGLHVKEDVQRDLELTNIIFHALPIADSREKRLRRKRSRDAVDSLANLVKWTIGREMSARFRPADAYCEMTMNADDFVVDTVDRVLGPKGAKQALIRFEAEERPGRTNGVDLHPAERDALGVPRPILTWKPSDDDLEAVRLSALQLGRAFGEMEIGRLELDTKENMPFRDVVTAWHQLGTMRMATSPTAGVTDQNCKVYGAGELYVAGGATFPTGGRANPTLTIVALAIRLGDHLKGRMLG